MFRSTHESDLEDFSLNLIDEKFKLSLVKWPTETKNKFKQENDNELQTTKHHRRTHKRPYNRRLETQAAKLNQKIINASFCRNVKILPKIAGVAARELNEFLPSRALNYDKMHADELKPQTTTSKRCDERGARSVFSDGPEI